jgi:hypothetical protein
MKPKIIVKIVLLVFVAASAGYLTFDYFSSPSRTEAAEETGAIAGGDSSAGASLNENKAEAPGRKVIAYYFHTEKRCPTCLKIESYTGESLRTAFAKQIGEGKLEFRAVNVDEPANRHFIDDYGLTTKSVVLVDYRDGKREDWKNLDMIWDYVGEKQTFMDYIQTETRNMLGELGYE